MISKIPRKNCTECTLRHRTCVFESPSHRQSTRCINNKLTCLFKFSGESSLSFFPNFFYSIQLNIFIFFQEQGRRNDLYSKCVSPVPQDLMSTPGISKNIKVIVFTATPCHVWHPGPDATLLII